MWDSFGDVVQTHTHTHTRAEMPDGYVKVLFEMMLQFFMPAEFIQERVIFLFFSKVTGKKKIIIVVYHSICLCDMNCSCVIHACWLGRVIQTQNS